jgi:hypothetical protein
MRSASAMGRGCNRWQPPCRGPLPRGDSILGPGQRGASGPQNDDGAGILPAPAVECDSLY